MQHEPGYMRRAYSGGERLRQQAARELAQLLTLARWQWARFPTVCRLGVRRD